MTENIYIIVPAFYEQEVIQSTARKVLLKFAVALSSLARLTAAHNGPRVMYRKAVACLGNNAAVSECGDA